MTLRDVNGRFASKGGKVATPRNRTKTLAELVTGTGKVPPNQVINIVGFVRDKSGSMSQHANDLNRLSGDLWISTANATRTLNQQTYAALYDFSNGWHTVLSLRDVQALPVVLPPVDIGGGTDLYRSVCEIIEDMERKAPPGADVAFLLNVLTDGGATDPFFLARFKALVADKQRQGNWTLSFQLPPGWADCFANITGIPRDNLREWESTRAGLTDTIMHTSSAMQSFTNSRAMGQKSVTTYYAPVTTDLSQVSVNTLKQQLNDVSARIRSISADKECPIRSLVEAKTGAPYIIGSAYYQLMKREEVQPQKHVLIQEKGKRQIWAGDEARALIGLPQAHEGKLAKVTPGNHSNYDIFVQSTSVNRLVPRGTRVLIDQGQQQNLKPTWYHNAVAKAP